MYRKVCSSPLPFLLHPWSLPRRTETQKLLLPRKRYLFLPPLLMQTGFWFFSWLRGILQFFLLPLFFSLSCLFITRLCFGTKEEEGKKSRLKSSDPFGLWSQNEAGIHLNNTLKYLYAAHCSSRSRFIRFWWRPKSGKIISVSHFWAPVKKMERETVAAFSSLFQSLGAFGSERKTIFGAFNFLEFLVLPHMGKGVFLKIVIKRRRPYDSFLENIWRWADKICEMFSQMLFLSLSLVLLLLRSVHKTTELASPNKFANLYGQSDVAMKNFGNLSLSSPSPPLLLSLFWWIYGRLKTGNSLMKPSRKINQNLPFFFFPPLRDPPLLRCKTCNGPN